MALALAVAAGDSAFGKTVLNVDFGMLGSHPSGPVSVQYTGTAAAPDTGTQWNFLQVDDNNAFQGPPGEFGFWTQSVTVSNLVNSQGTPTAFSVTAIGTADTGAFGIVQTATNNLAAVATNAVDLMRDYLIGFNAAQTVELNGFTPGTAVDLYLYGAGDTSNRDTLFSVTDSNGSHSATTTGTLTNDTNAPVAHTLTLGGDYIVLSNILADNSGKITISYDNGAGSGEAPFNGLQVVFGILAGDANDDNVVNMADYLLIRNNFRLTGATRAQGDVTSPLGGNIGDGVVDFYDFALWRASTSAEIAAQVASIPEPATCLLAILAVGGLVCLRRK